MSEPEQPLYPSTGHEPSGESERASSPFFTPTAPASEEGTAVDSGAPESAAAEPPSIPTQPVYETPAPVSYEPASAAPFAYEPAPATPDYAAPTAPEHAAPAAPQYAPPQYAAPQYSAPQYPPAPAAPQAPMQPVYQSPVAPQFGAPQPMASQPVAPYSAVPASVMPASASPASALPASGQPAGYPTPTYAPGYQAGPGYPAYGTPVPPTSQLPAGAMQAPAPKRGKAAIIVLSILTAVFVLATAGLTVLFLGSQSDLSKEKKTVASQQTQIAQLNKANSDTATELSTLKSSTDDQIKQLKSDKGSMSKCINDVDTLISLPRSASVATVNKDYDKMVADCAVAKALSD